MTHDPLADLRRELVRAARRQAPAPSRRPRRRNRRLALVVVVALLLPGLGLATGVIDLGSGTTPDGTTYRITTFSDALDATGTFEDGRGRICQKVTFTREGRRTGGSVSCSPIATAPSREPIAASRLIVSGNTALVFGSVSDRVAALQIEGAAVQPELRAQPGSARRTFAVALPNQQPVVLVARSSDGNALQRLDGAALAPSSVPSVAP